VKDNFSNTEFGAMGGTSAAMRLHRMISDKFGFRGEFQVPESLPMCAMDRALQIDVDEAFLLGEEAVSRAAAGSSGLMTTFVRGEGSSYGVSIGTIPLNEVAAKTKPLPKEFIADGGLMVTEAFRTYITPLVGMMPEYIDLHPNSVKKG
jgi:ATP-dependent phosphofructokinase / diphosphate-dependent phosphofructokinase